MAKKIEKNIFFYSEMNNVLLKNKRKTICCNILHSFNYAFNVNESLEDGLYELKVDQQNFPNLFYNKTEKQWYLKINNENINKLTKYNIFLGKCKAPVFSTKQDLSKVNDFLEEKRHDLISVFEKCIVNPNGEIFAKVNLVFSYHLYPIFSVSKNYIDGDYLSSVNFLKLKKDFKNSYHIGMIRGMSLIGGFNLNSVKDDSFFDGFIEDEISLKIKSITIDDEDKKKFIYLYGEEYFNQINFIANSFLNNDSAILFFNSLLNNVRKKYLIVNEIEQKNNLIENKNNMHF